MIITLLSFVTLVDGSTKTFDLAGKWSSSIFAELMDTVGGENWEQWKLQRTAEGLPIVDVPIPKKVEAKQPARKKSRSQKEEPPEVELHLDPTKTGAAAILP